MISDRVTVKTNNLTRLRAREETSKQLKYEDWTEALYMNEKKFYSYIYSFKCRACFLEFKIFSWEDDWIKKHEAFCPECRGQDVGFLNKEVSEKSIALLMYANEDLR